MDENVSCFVLALCVFFSLKKYTKNYMENIIEPNDQFDFSKLLLTHPVSIPGGAYFTKILNANKSLYVQTLKSVTRQGIVKNGKKYSCELMFDSQSAETIHWFERLEETCQKLLFEKNEQWFQNSLEPNDIETAFIPVIRIFKSGKYYLVRSNIKATNEDQPMLKVYNENKQSMMTTDITNETSIMALLEIQGIKFTTRSFQIEIEMKQIMILNDDALFDNCLIKTQSKKKSSKPVAMEVITTPTVIKEKVLEEVDKRKNVEEGGEEKTLVEVEKVEEREVPMTKSEFESEKNDFLEINDLGDIDELKEVDNLNVDHVEGTVILKQPNEVYLELYKKAREKAKAIKREMILSFLEAKHIKESYMIDVFDENEYNIDAEIDAVSENELDTL
jgi:hypothetical protein